MICKIGLCLVVGLALAICSDADLGVSKNVRNLRNKYSNLVGRGRSGGSAAASAAAGANGASSSVAGGFGNHGGYAPAGPYQVPPQQPYYGHQSQAPYVDHQPAFMPPHHIPRGGPHYEDGGLIPDHGHAYNPYPAPVFGQEPLQYHYGQPHQSVPHHLPSSHGFVKGPRVPGYAHQPAATPSAAAAAAAASGGHNGGAAASAAAGGRNGGAAAAAAVSAGHRQHHHAPEHNYHTVDQEGFNEHYYEPETEEHYQAAAGTFNGPQNNFEHGSYVRSTEDETAHEDGREDGDHYYNAKAHSKTADQNDYTAYSDSNDDVLHTPYVYHKKKSNTNFVSTSNKQHRESGSGVVAHDKHSAMYNKDYKKLKENVDQRFSKGADGVVHNQNSNSNMDFEDEDERSFDTRGLGNFVGVDGIAHPKRASQTAAAAAAASAGGSAAASAAASGASFSHRR